MRTSSRLTQLPFVAQFLTAAILAVALSLWVFSLLMKPPMNDMLLMVQFLSITAIASVLIGYLTYRLGWIDLSPTIRYTILGGYALASVLTFLNVWVTASLMFTSQHDLILSAVLLFFAGGIATALGMFFSSVITDRLRSLDQAVQQVSQGKLETRVVISGKDEIARLGKSLNQMAAQLEEAHLQKREAETLRRDLIAWVSHDLQTPLASIRAIIEALADGVIEDRQEVQRYMSITRREIGALSALIDDLFQMAQLDAGGVPLNREFVSLTDLISDTLESFSTLADQHHVTLQGRVSPGIEPVFVDARQISRVLANLVSNGIRYTTEGGSVEVSTEKHEAEIRIEVSDNGEGITPEDLPFIFERFYRSEKSRNRATGGAGLGLAIAQSIVEAHGGMLTTTSQPGRTSFQISLPVIKPL